MNITDIKLQTREELPGTTTISLSFQIDGEPFYLNAITDNDNERQKLITIKNMFFEMAMKAFARHTSKTSPGAS